MTSAYERFNKVILTVQKSKLKEKQNRTESLENNVSVQFR